MSADVLTTWAVVLDLDLQSGERGLDPAGRCFAVGLEALLERCPRLAAFLEAEGADLRLTAERVGPLPVSGHADRLLVGVSVVEVRLSSFDMAVRIRPGGDAVGSQVDGRCTIVIEHRGTGKRVPVPDDVRDEFIGLQLAARDLC